VRLDLLRSSLTSASACAAAKSSGGLFSHSAEMYPASRDDSSCQRANRGRAEGPAGGVQDMSRLDAVVRVLKATGKALHYNLITRKALQQGIIRFTGSRGTAGESMQAFLNKTIRENKTAAIVNMGKVVYGLKAWTARPLLQWLTLLVTLLQRNALLLLACGGVCPHAGGHRLQSGAGCLLE